MKLNAMNERVKVLRENAMGKDIVAVARIPLKFACETKFQKSEKSDGMGACMIYITLEAVAVTRRRMTEHT